VTRKQQRQQMIVTSTHTIVVCIETKGDYQCYRYLLLWQSHFFTCSELGFRTRILNRDFLKDFQEKDPIANSQGFLIRIPKDDSEGESQASIPHFFLTLGEYYIFLNRTCLFSWLDLQQAAILSQRPLHFAHGSWLAGTKRLNLNRGRFYGPLHEWIATRKKRFCYTNKVIC